jgi:hypothetical protein
MSETEHNIGKLKPMGMVGGVEATAKRILKAEGWASDYDTYAEALEDYGYREYVLHNEVIYKVIENNEPNPYDDIFRASRNDDGTINFETKYYNGGCGFCEALVEALNNLDNDKD